MFAVGRIGSYISRGVYTVSGPFHPFGGAVDIIVVEQQDGSFKSSPWYVRFGKFQGVLKAKERMVSINVNGVDADFHMYLDHKGEAFFVREVDGAEGELVSYLSSEDEKDVKSDLWRTQKSRSCNYDSNRKDLVSELEASSNGKILAQNNSRRGKIFGLAFGRRSMKENGVRDEECAVEVNRDNSFERAEIAADLLEVNWTTNIRTGKRSNASTTKGPNVPVPHHKKSLSYGDDGAMVDSSMPYEGNVGSNGSVCEESLCSTEETNGENPCLRNPGNYVETLTIEETYMGVDHASDRSNDTDIVDNGTIVKVENAHRCFSEVYNSSSKFSQALDAKENKDSVSSGEENSNRSVSQGGNTSEAKSRSYNAESFMCHDSLENSSALLNNCSGQTNESERIASQVFQEPKDQTSDVCSPPVLAIPASEMDNNQEDLEAIASYKADEKTLSDTGEAQFAAEVCTSPLHNMDERHTVDLKVRKEFFEEVTSNELLNSENSTIVESCNCASGSVSELSPEDPFTTSSNLNVLPPDPDKESSVDDLSGPPLSLHDEECIEDSTQERNINVKPLEHSEEEQFSFSDLDDARVRKVEQIDSSSSDGGEECFLRGSPRSTEEVSEAKVAENALHQLTDEHIQDDLLIHHPSTEMKSIRVSSWMTIPKVQNDADEEPLVPIAKTLPNMLFHGDELCSEGVPQPLSHSLDSNVGAMKKVENGDRVTSECGLGEQQVAGVQPTADSSHISEIKRIVSDPAVEVSLCRHLLYEGMGYEAAAHAFDAEKLDKHKFASLNPDIVKNEKLVVRIGGLYFPWYAALPIASAIGLQEGEQILEPKGMIAVEQVDNTSEGDPQKSLDSRNGSWKLWPFSFKRSNKSRSFDSDSSSESCRAKDGNTDVLEPRITKKKMLAKAPTSDQLVSLNLREGKNVVTFTFSTEMLGEQQVDARIFLWKWNTRIVISDVDGTITKSDVLGQFMPLVGIDWSQTGVTHLFSAIKENGYQLLFLSARSISQAYHTRQFLINLKQEGKALPEGPVVISPDGLFPSLYREVIRRAPHEFKIACLEDIKELFPPDHSPFYAGFGNRDTDELSYLKVGIPRGKIFTINPKGEIAVNRQVDTKSYTSLHALVHGMFPPTNVTEQEDFNSWNFWRLPPADVGI